MAVLALVCLWGAVAYRLALLRRSPSTWRRSFAFTILAVGMGATSHFAADRLQGPTTMGILRYVSITCMAQAASWVSIYVEALRYRTPRRRAVHVHLAIGGLLAAANLAWWLWGEHGHDLTLLPVSLPVEAMYCESYLYIAVALAGVVGFCARQVRTQWSFSHSVPLVAIGSACALGLVYALSSIYSVAWRHSPTAQLPWAGLLVYPALALLGSGVVALVTSPILARLATSLRIYWQLRPLWQSLTQQNPAMRLSVPMQRNPLAVIEQRTHRLVTEIHDALRGLTVDAPPGAGPAALAEALHRHNGTTPAPAVLRPVETVEDERRQLVELARHYERHTP